MKKIHSNINKEKLLHLILRKEDVVEERYNIIDDQEYLQLAAMLLPKGKTFIPHRHVDCKKTVLMTQESWVVISGKVKAILYDLDDSVITEEILNAGDCSVTFYGGHNYEILEDNTLVYEYKTGPYEGQKLDKVSIKN